MNINIVNIFSYRICLSRFVFNIFDAFEICNNFWNAYYNYNSIIRTHAHYNEQNINQNVSNDTDKLFLPH